MLDWILLYRFFLWIMTNTSLACALPTIMFLFILLFIVCFCSFSLSNSPFCLFSTFIPLLFHSSQPFSLSLSSFSLCRSAARCQLCLGVLAQSQSVCFGGVVEGVSGRETRGQSRGEVSEWVEARI